MEGICIATIEEFAAAVSTAEGSNIYDLQGKTITLVDGAKINFSEGITTMQNGCLECGSGSIAVSGASTAVTFGPDLTIVGNDTILHVQRRGNATLSGCTVSVSGTSPAISVEGSGLAKENSALTVKSQCIVSSPEIALEVTKGGLIRIEEGCSVTADTAVIAKGNRTRLEISSSSVHGELDCDDDVTIFRLDTVDEPEDSVEEEEVTHCEVEEPKLDEVAEIEITKPAEIAEPNKVDLLEDATALPIPRSAVLTKETRVYGATSTKSYICNIVGAVQITRGSGNFWQIRFKMPGGAGRFFVGYISKSSAIREA